MNSLFNRMNVGVGLRSAHHNHFISNRPQTVSWVEVISENFMPWKDKGLSKSFHTLSQVRASYPVALHGVSMNLGSSDPLDFDYLNRLKVLIDAIQPFHVSDHLSWTGVRGENVHDLLPLPYTEEALRLFTDKVSQAQDFLGRRILIENPSSYMEFKHSEMTEPEFISELIKRTDCSLLLDVNNIYVSSINHFFDPLKYLQQIPLDRVQQIHLAGHSVVKDSLIDTHDQPVCEEVWKLYQEVVKIIGPQMTMIERDGNIPEWEELETELKRIGEIHAQHAGP